MSEKVSRGDFLKLAGFGLGTLAFNPLRTEKTLGSSYDVFAGINDGVTLLAVVDKTTGQMSMGVGDPQPTLDANGKTITLMQGWRDVVEGNGSILIEDPSKRSKYRKSPGNNYMVHDLHYTAVVGIVPEVFAKGTKFGSPEFNNAVASRQYMVDPKAEIVITESSLGERKSMAVKFNSPNAPRFTLKRLSPIEPPQQISQTNDLFSKKDVNGNMQFANYIVTAEPTATEAPVDPEAWQEAGNVVWQNKNLAPYGKQLVVNPELQEQLGETVFNLCNQYTFLAEMANEIQTRQNQTPLPDAKYQSFDNYKKLVIDPAIAQNTTIEGYHLVGHETRANKSPYIGMVKPFGEEIDLSACSIKINGKAKIYPESLVIDVGSYQIGMSTVKKDGRNIRELIINTNMTRENQYKYFYSNESSTSNENAIAFSQLIQAVSESISSMATKIPNSPVTQYKNGDFVLGKDKPNDPVAVMLYTPTGSMTLPEFIADSVSKAPNFLIPQNP